MARLPKAGYRAVGRVAVPKPLPPPIVPAAGRDGAAGSPGEPPSPADIAAAVEAYLLAYPIPAGGQGPPPSPEAVAEAVARFMAANPPAAGRDGQPGADGAPGPLPPETELERVIRQTVAGMEELRGPRGYGSAGYPGRDGDPGPAGPPGPAGEGRQEVFIDEQPAIAYPAISFTQAVGYPGLYVQSVNA